MLIVEIVFEFFSLLLRKLIKMQSENLHNAFHAGKIYKIIAIIMAFCLAILVLFLAVNLVEKKVFYPLRYKDEIVKYSTKYGLDENLIFSIVKCESSFNENAISSKNAMGLMQITQPTADYIAQKLSVKNYDLFDIDTNLNFGCYYLSYLYKKFKNIDTVIVAYNAGEGNVSNWLKNENYSKDGISLNKIPFPETRSYLEEIKKTLAKYKKLYGNIVDKR